MNRLAIALLLLPMAYVGCTTDADSLADTVQMPIAYQVSADQAQTRGEAITSSTFAQSGRQFILWGWMSDSNGESPMNSEFNEEPLQGILVKNRLPERDEWTTDKVYFWPLPRFRADFYAIYPGTAPFDKDTKTIKYTDFDGNDDVMYATYSDQRPKKDVLEKQRLVYLHFYHAMSQIRFCGKLSQEFAALGYQVQVKSIKICNVKKAASLKLSAAVNSIGENPGKETALTISDWATPGDYTAVMNVEANTENYPIVNSTTSSVQLTSTTDILMLLPQTVTAWNPETEKTGSSQPSTSDGYLAINLRIIYNNNGTDIYPLKPDSSDGSYVTVYTPFNSGIDDSSNPIAWKSGKAYIYELIFGVGYSAAGNPIIQPITIQAAIAPWQSTAVPGTAKH